MFSPIIRVALFIALIGAAVMTFMEGNDFGAVALILGALYVFV